MAIQKIGDTLIVPVSTFYSDEDATVDCDSTREVKPGDPDYDRLLAEYENPPSYAAAIEAFFRNLDKDQ